MLLVWGPYLEQQGLRGQERLSSRGMTSHRCHLETSSIASLPMLKEENCTFQSLKDPGHQTIPSSPPSDARFPSTNIYFPEYLSRQRRPHCGKSLLAFLSLTLWISVELLSFLSFCVLKEKHLHAIQFYEHLLNTYCVPALCFGREVSPSPPGV